MEWWRNMIARNLRIQPSLGRHGSGSALARRRNRNQANGHLLHVLDRLHRRGRIDRTPHRAGFGADGALRMRVGLRGARYACWLPVGLLLSIFTVLWSPALAMSAVYPEKNPHALEVKAYAS